MEGTIRDAFGDVSGDTAVYVSPVDSDTEVDSNDQPQRAASDIKLFVMIAAYQQVKDGELSLSDDYTLTDSDKVDGTGKLREMADGTKISIKDLIGYMMEDSDNTAANIMIRKLGGMAAVNHQIDKMGATVTKLERMLMDTDALEDGKDNYTSAKDLGTALKKIYNHQMVSRKYDEEMLTILKQNGNHTKLPHDLPTEATVYNKTGEFDDYGVENDAAIFGNQKGAFVIVVMSQDGQRDEQINAMNSFGSVMYKGLLE
ncbi:class A beta-lactamase-related serine hydrolase [Pediococcus acidilactici]